MIVNDAQSRSHSRPGFTLVESLVVIGVCGLVFSLALPAVQAAREASRRIQCTSNIRQVGIAVQTYLARYGAYPSPCGFVAPRGGPGHLEWMYSLFTRITADLDRADLYHAINFMAPVADPYAVEAADDRNHPNTTAMATSLGVLLCPSDPRRDSLGWTGGTNYRANLGTERWWLSVDGPFARGQAELTPAGIPDGLSSTAGFSEKLRGRDRDHSQPSDFRTALIVGPAAAFPSANEARRACQRWRPLPLKFYPATGLTWFVGTLGQSNYNHTLEPNSTIPDCACPSTTANCGLVAARSNHPGGVNVGFMDGSVKFLSQSIHLETWRALGSRAGGEGHADLE